MRHTLEQLKAMSDQELGSHWMKSRFPFETANCWRCVTQHASFGCAEHRELEEQVALFRCYEVMGQSSMPDAEVGRILREHIEELYALRLFYDHLYPQTAAQEDAKEVLAADDVAKLNESLQDNLTEMQKEFVRIEGDYHDSRANTR